MNETALIQKVWNYATVLQNDGIHYADYIAQVSFLLFLKMDDESATRSAIRPRCRRAAVGVSTATSRARCSRPVTPRCSPSCPGRRT